MPRFPPPGLDTLTPAQQAVYDATRTGRRGTVPANVLAWLPSPEFAGRAARLGEFVRYETSLPAQWSELAILVVARHWSCQYEWAVHAGEAVRAGVADDVIADIGAGRVPDLAGEARVVHDVARSVVASGGLDDAAFAAGEAALGRQGLVELIGLVGYYTMVALTLNAFAVPVPDGAPRLP
jgi:4-carboxymuconolactone decarboxylase